MTVIQNTIIDGKLYHKLFIPDLFIEDKEEYTLKPVNYDGNYFILIPKTTIRPIKVNKDSNIIVSLEPL